MSENSEARKVIVSEKTYEKLSQEMKDNIMAHGYEIEIVSKVDKQLSDRMKEEQKGILLLDTAEAIECEVYNSGIKNAYKDLGDLTFPIHYLPRYEHPVYSTKTPKPYVPRTIGKPINKKKGGR